jgi:senataxin
VTDYKKSFVPSLIEETHADLLSNITAVSQAPAWEIDSVEISEDFEPPQDLFYEIKLVENDEDSDDSESDEDTEKDDEEEENEPQKGDVIALTDVRPKCIDDLNRPKRFYLIAYVLGPRNALTDTISILASKPIWTDQNVHKYENKKQPLFAVYLMNLITNVRIWDALDPPEGGNTIIETVLQANSPVRILSHFVLECRTCMIHSRVLLCFSCKTDIPDDALYVFIIPNRMTKIV